MAKQQRKRIPVDPAQIDMDLESDELRELLGVPEDVWASLPDSQKILLFTKRGIQASRDALNQERDEG